MGLFLLAFFLSLSITPLISFISEKFNILYYPNSNTIHKSPIPIIGGVCIWLAFSIILLFNISVDLLIILIAATLVFVVGLLDDLKKDGISSYIRIFFQILAGIIIISRGMTVTFLPNTWWGNLFENIITIIWIVGITNAYNLLDGLDGLACGSAVINVFFFLLISYFTLQEHLAVVCLILLGSCTGFLFYNLNPAKIFLGSCGSTFIGFVLACIALFGNWAEGNLVNLSVPILILGIPIFDISMTTILRFKNGYVHSIKEWFDYKGKDHYHYQLVDMGLSHRNAVYFMYCLTSIIGVSGVVLITPEANDAFLLIVQAILILTSIIIFFKQTKTITT